VRKKPEPGKAEPLEAAYSEADEISEDVELGAAVTDIAAQHSLLEQGHFSVRYRERSGETPSKGLARRIGQRWLTPDCSSHLNCPFR
jgi:hypothetical protein